MANVDPQAHSRSLPPEGGVASLGTARRSAGDPILEARGIHAWYGSSHVLHGIDLTIGRGETIGLLGRNGMGKSTLIRTLLGHVTQRDGRIHLFGQDLSQRQASTKWRGAAWPMCRKAAACSRTCRCARTSSCRPSPARATNEKRLDL